MIDGEKLPTWFKPLLNDAKQRAGSRLALANELGVTPRTISNWEEGSAPGLDHLQTLFKYMHGDLRRALPGHEEAWPAILIRGQVQAGHLTVSGEYEYEIEDGVPAVWRHSPLWSHTQGPIIYVEVIGDSMAPEYEAHEIIACRSPRDPKTLPDGTPCIFRERTETTFKILRWGASDMVIGEPINPAYDFIAFDKKELAITHVVLGKFDIGGTVPRPRGNLR